MNSIRQVKRLVVPLPITYPFTQFADTWLDFVQANNGKLVALKTQSLMGVHGLSDRLVGWQVEGEILPPAGTSSWVPEKWLVEPTAITKDCDCPLDLLLRQGCQNSQHQ